jgi:general secretion pathway protein G
MKSRTALILQWTCLAIPFVALLVALWLDPHNDKLFFRFDLVLFATAIVWFVFVAVFRRKYSISYKFPLGLLAVSFLGFISTPFYICSDCGGLRQGAAQGQIKMFGVALENYKRDVGRYPSTKQGLQALRIQPEDFIAWDGPYLQKDIPNDPWGHPYIYKFPGKTPDKPEIVSYGADGVPGGEGQNADIISE